MASTTVGFALISGAAIDRFRATSILPYFLLPLSGACFALAYSGPEISLFIVMVLLGISYGISSTLFGSLWPEVYGLANLGAVRSVTVAAAVLATAAGPGLTGTLIDRGTGLPTQMVFFGGYCLLAALAMTIASISLRRRA
jgi:MFS family permease